MHDLAVVAENSGTLPSFALTASGNANVTRTLSVDTTTLWDQAVKGFSKETLTGYGQHNPELNWTLSPVVSAPQLEALHYACLWALWGPPPEGSRAMELLRELRIEDLNACAPPGTERPKLTYHLGVARQLADLPCGWLHVTSNDCVPKDACYRSTCGSKTVWVSPEGMAGLSEFTLIMLDIATISPTSLAVSPPTVSVAVQEVAKEPDLSVVSWDHDDLPTRQKNLVVVGEDDKHLLHIRIFDGAGNVVTDTDETKLPAAPALTVSSLKTKLPSLRSKGFTIDQQSQILANVRSILGQPPTTNASKDKFTETWFACQDPSGVKAGAIKLIRPTFYKGAPSDTPRIDRDPTAVQPAPTPPRPTLLDTFGLSSH
jgi:hypothetical protein